MKDLIEASVGDAMSWSNIENAKSCQIVKSSNRQNTLNRPLAETSTLATAIVRRAIGTECQVADLAYIPI